MQRTFSEEKKRAEGELERRNRSKIEKSKSGSEEEVWQRRRAGRSICIKESFSRIHFISLHFFFMCPVASDGSNSLVVVSLEGK